MYKSQPYYIKQQNVPQKRINTMIYYLFPRFCLYPNSQLKCAYYNTLCVISPSQYYYINEIKNRIENTPHWGKKSKNIYEKLCNKITIAQCSIVFFEIIEVCQLMHFNWNHYSTFTSLHFDKASIKSISYLRRNLKNDETILCKSNMLEKYKTITTPFVDVAFCSAYLDEEYENCIELFKQICIVLCMQKQKGSCIIKFGESYSTLSLDIFCLLSYFYEKTYFIKPSASDLSTGEKYIVCKHFLHEKLTEKTKTTIFSLYNQITNSKLMLSRIINIDIPLFITSKMEEINSIFGQPRLEYIQQLLSQSEIKEDTSDHKCQEWIQKYIPELALTNI